MGCVGPKSLISVRNDATFLDLTVQQIEVFSLVHHYCSILCTVCCGHCDKYSALYCVRALFVQTIGNMYVYTGHSMCM